MLNLIFKRTMCAALTILVGALGTISVSAAETVTPAAAPAPAAAPVKASGYNVQRIEQEDRYAVPAEISEEVWKFVEETFVRDRVFLESLGAGFSSYFNEEDFFDVYFDTPSLQLLKTQSGVRHRRRINVTNPKDRKSGRELLQIKLSPEGESLLERKEMKFEIKHRSVLKKPEDIHPLLGIVRRSQREDLKAALRSFGIDPYQMRPVLGLADRRARIYLLKDKQPFISISHDVAYSIVNGKRADIIELEFELNEIAFTEAGPEKRRQMEEVSRVLIDKVLKRFPELKRDLQPKYNRAYDQLQRQNAF